MDRGQADVIVADLAREIGIPSLALNPEGLGILTFEDRGAIVAIGYNVTAGSIDLMTCLDTVDPSPARSRAALRANFGATAAGGETLAIDPSTGAFILQRRYGGPDLIEGGLAGAVQGLLVQAGRWTRKLGAIADRPASDQPAQADRQMPPGGLRA